MEDDLSETVQCKVTLTSGQQAQINDAIGAVEGKKGQDAVQAAESAATWIAPHASRVTQDLFAGELLTLSGNGQEAWGVLSNLKERHPEIAEQAEFQLAWGASAYKVGREDVALTAFQSARTNSDYAPLAAGYQAYALTAKGRHEQARPYIEYFESQPKVAQDSWISRTLQKIFDVFNGEEKKP